MTQSRLQTEERNMLSRRSALRGLFAMPAIVAASSLMPIRGVPLVVWRRKFALLDAFGAVLAESDSHRCGGVVFACERAGVATHFEFDWLGSRQRVSLQFSSTTMVGPGMTAHVNFAPTINGRILSPEALDEFMS